MVVEAAEYIPSFQINAFEISTYRILKKCTTVFSKY